ncbi:hypothetical protein FMN63_25100 [Stappia sp. BW2]|uniref:endosialidase catalytic beta-propeller domain-containing protein n=1 Tax=Stappia sp. BW2 TaxID=2592622 RepID=UPI0011DEB2E6|nr:endosialidase catalytic beta-propeller domain-containing protein [Stappia sp. BW2]TYC65663.1 hypothetical protein FMN63_25100 [Stappia sp. BW2]
MSAVFPIETKARYAKYTATAGQTLFDIPFEFQQNRDVKVQKTAAAGGSPTVLTEGADYTVAGADVYNGGSFTLVAGAAAGDTLEIWGEAVLDRKSSVVQNGIFSSKTQDDEHDRHRIIQQELRRDTDRAVKVAFGESAQELPTPGSDQAVLGWSGSKLVNKVLVDQDLEALPATASTYLKRNGSGTAFVPMTRAEVFADLIIDKSIEFSHLSDGAVDFLKAFSVSEENSAADNKTALANLELVLSGREIDAGWKTISLPSLSDIPTGNNYKHGYWKVSNGEAVNPKDIKYPMADTLQVSQPRKLTSSRRYDGWPQGKFHESDGVIYFPWNQGTSHLADDLHPCMVRSFDGAQSAQDFERLFQQSGLTGGVTCWAADANDGQQFAIVRESETATEHKLYARRLGQKKKLTGQIVASNGSTSYQFIAPNHGVRSGNKIKFNSNVSIGGTTLVAGTEYTVTNGTPSRFYFIGPSASSDETLASADHVLTFVESGWTEINWGGTSLGSKLIADIADQTGQPTMFHSMACVPSSGGTVYTCVHGGSATAGPSLVKLTGLLGNSPAIEYSRKITTASRVEATVHRDTDGTLYGFARTQFTNNSPLAWWSDNDGVTMNTNIGGPVGFMQYSPIPLTMIGDTIFAFASENRTGTDDVSGNYEKREVPLYLLVADKTDFKANYWDAVEFIYLGTAYKWSDFEGLNAVFVGDIISFNGGLILMHSTDNEDPGVGTGVPDIIVTKIRVDDEKLETHGIQKAIGRSAFNGAPMIAVYDKLHVEELSGSSGVASQALVKGSDGTLYSGRNISVSRNSTGNYTLTWPALPSANRVFASVSCRNVNGYAQAVNVNTTGCTVYTKAYSTDAVADYDFQIEVTYISDWVRDAWA